MPAVYFFTIIVTVLVIDLSNLFIKSFTPSQPSPTGEGAGFTFPPWGKLKGGKNLNNR